MRCESRPDKHGHTCDIPMSRIKWPGARFPEHIEAEEYTEADAYIETVAGKTGEKTNLRGSPFRYYGERKGLKRKRKEATFIKKEPVCGKTVTTWSRSATECKKGRQPGKP